MKRFLGIAVLVFMAQVTLCVQNALALNYYVSLAGNDANNGLTTGTPFRHLQFAVSYPMLACGDTINIRAGSWDESIGIGNYGPPYNIHTTLCSSWGSHITLKPYNGETVTWSSSTSPTVIGFQGGDYPSATTPIYWELSGFHCSGALQTFPLRNSCIDAEAASYVRINGVEISDFQETGVFVDNYNSSYDVAGWEFIGPGCNVHDTGLGGNDPGPTHSQPQGLYLTHMTGILVEGCGLHDNFGYGLQANAYNSTVRSNRIYFNNLDPAAANGGMNIGNGDNNLVYNNLFWGNRAVALQINDSCGGCAAYANTVTQNTYGIVIARAARTTLADNISFNNLAAFDCFNGNAPTINITDCGASSVLKDNQTNDPSFSSSTPGDPNFLKLQSTSSAICYQPSGNNNLAFLGVSALNLDYAGTSRPATGAGCWTVGSYNFGGMVTPAITVIDPVSGVQGATALPFAITGNSATNFGGISVASFGSGITVDSMSLTCPDAMHCSGTITIAGGASLGIRTVHVVTGAEDASLSGFTVISGAVASIVSVNPGTIPQGVNGTIFCVGGNATHFTNGVSVMTFNPSSGITVHSTSVTDATHGCANVDVDPAASLGARDVIMTTASIPETATATNGMTIVSSTNCPGSGAISIVTGQCVSQSGVDGTSTLVTPSLPANATVAAGHAIQVHSLIGCKDGGCTVTTSNPVTSVTSPSVSSFHKCGSTATNLTGQIETWAGLVTSAGGAPVTMNLTNPQWYSVIFSEEVYGTDAATNPCDVSGSSSGTSTTPSISTSSPTTVANGICFAVISSGAAAIHSNSPYTDLQNVPDNVNAFTVAGGTGTKTATFTSVNADYIGLINCLKPLTPGPVFVSVSPNSALQNTVNVTASFVWTGSHFVDGQTQVLFDNMGGITINSVNVSSGTAATVNFDVSIGALAGFRDLIVTTGTEVLTQPKVFYFTPASVPGSRVRTR